MYIGVVDFLVGSENIVSVPIESPSMEEGVKIVEETVARFLDNLVGEYYREKRRNPFRWNICIFAEGRVVPLLRYGLMG